MASRTRDIFAFTCAAIACGSVVVACDSPSGQIGAAPPRERVAAAPQVRPVEEITVPAPPAAAPAPAPRLLSDNAITRRIRSAIASDPGMAGADVSVNTLDGVVVLVGVVRTPEQTGIASAHAQRQDGVLRVDNQLAFALS